jgi:hypothetical protein
MEIYQDVSKLEVPIGRYSSINMAVADSSNFSIFILYLEATLLFCAIMIFYCNCKEYRNAIYDILTFIIFEFSRLFS